MDPRHLPQDWPFRANARRTRAGTHDWWVIDTGPRDAPVVLLLHGVGASGHSFRHLIAPLSDRYRVVVPDLPGQGCSRAGSLRRLGLDPMAEDILTLCKTLDVKPAAVIGHSAGAALALRLCEIAPLRTVVGVNAALGAFDGAAGLLFPVLAQGLAAAPFAGRVFSRLFGSSRAVDKLLASTGSTLTPAGRAMYLRLVQNPAHIEGALGMMAQWNLDGLLRRLPQITQPVLLIAAEGDRTVPCDVSRKAAVRLPAAELRLLPGLGHLPHEELPDGLASVILPWLADRI